MRPSHGVREIWDQGSRKHSPSFRGTRTIPEYRENKNTLGVVDTKLKLGNKSIYFRGTWKQVGTPGKALFMKTPKHYWFSFLIFRYVYNAYQVRRTKEN